MDAADSNTGLPEYAALLAARHTAHAPELRRLLEELWGGRSLKVLDVACGDGFYAAAFDAVLGPGSAVTAVDLSPAFLEWAEECVSEPPAAARRVSFVQADAERLPFADGTFDVVWCAQSLISLPDPVASLGEMRRVTRPGGTVGILENDRLHEIQLPWPASFEVRLRAAEHRADSDDGTDGRLFTGRRLEDLMREAGLTPNRRITLPIDRRAPLGPADEAFLESYFHAVTEQTAGALDPETAEEFRRLTDPRSPDYLPARPDFWVTWTDVVVLAGTE